jgi:CHASE3 domain sensor protein
MSLRTKLTVGLGFLFVIIFALSLYSLYDIQRLSSDADRILRDNYDSLVYCKSMLTSLDDMRNAAGSILLDTGSRESPGYSSELYRSSRAKFETSLAAEQKNITEAHEGDYVRELTQHYDLFVSACQQMNSAARRTSLYFNDILPAYLDTRQAIAKVNDLNMEAIERKNLAARHNASTMINSLAVVGGILIIVAFFYFWYFPFYVSHTVSYLSRKMKQLLEDAGIKVDIRTNDEAFILLQSIDLLEEKFARGEARAVAKQRGRRRS